MLFPAFAWADIDEGLYDPVAPEGSAFVRFLNAGAVEISPVLDGKSYENLAPNGLSPYVVKPAGEVKVALGNTSAKISLEEGKFYTLILHNGVPSILEDPASNNRAKALLVFYNLTDHETLALKTADGKIEIIAPVAKGGNSWREINAVRIGFSAYDGEIKAAGLEGKTLERSAAYAVIAVSGTDGKTILLFNQARTDTTQ